MPKFLSRRQVISDREANRFRITWVPQFQENPKVSVIRIWSPKKFHRNRKPFLAFHSSTEFSNSFRVWASKSLAAVLPQLQTPFCKPTQLWQLWIRVAFHWNCSTFIHGGIFWNFSISVSFWSAGGAKGHLYFTFSIPVWQNAPKKTGRFQQFLFVGSKIPNMKHLSDWFIG